MGKRSSIARRDRDFYRTPPEAVAPLLPHLPYGASFVEPCAGDMALALALEAEGMSCLHALDIEPRADDVTLARAAGVMSRRQIPAVSPATTSSPATPVLAAAARTPTAPSARVRRSICGTSCMARGGVTLPAAALGALLHE